MRPKTGEYQLRSLGWTWRPCIFFVLFLVLVMCLCEGLEKVGGNPQKFRSSEVTICLLFLF